MGEETIDQKRVIQIVYVPVGGHSFLDNLLGTAGTNVTAAGLGIASSILAARLLGPDGRGELAAIQNWPLLLTAFGSLGVTVATAYYCGRYPYRASQIFATAWVFLVALSFPVMAIGYWLMPWLLQAQVATTVESARVLLLLVLIHFAGALPYWAFQGLGRFKAWNVIRIQMPLLWLTVLVISIILSIHSPAFVAFGYLLAMAAHSLTWTIVMVLTVRGPYRPDIACLPELLRYGLPSVLTSIPQHLNLRLDQLLMAAFLPAHTLGLYVVAVAWSGVFSPLLTSVSQVIFPHLAATHDALVQADTLQRALRLSVLTTAILSTVLSTLTPLVFPLFFGSNFSEAVPATIVLIAAGGVASINQVASEGLRGLGVPKWPILAEFVGLGITIALLALLLVRYQLMGAAVASLTSYSATLVTLVLLIAHKTGVGPWKIIVPNKHDVALLRSQFLKIAAKMLRLS